MLRCPRHPLANCLVLLNCCCAAGADPLMMALCADLPAATHHAHLPEAWPGQGTSVGQQGRRAAQASAPAASQRGRRHPRQTPRCGEGM